MNLPTDKISLSLAGVVPYDRCKKAGRLPLPAVYERRLSMPAVTQWRETLIAGVAILVYKYTGAREVRLGWLPETRLIIRLGQPGQTRFDDTVGDVCSLLDRDRIKSSEPLPPAHQMPDLILHCTRTEEDVLVSAEYDTLIYAEDTVRRLLSHLDTLLCSAAEDGSRCLAAMNMLPEEEARLIEEVFNGTTMSYENAACSLKKLFADSVRRHPQAVAVVAEEEVLTYSEFDERAAKLAAVLRKNGVGAGDIVAVMAGRSVNTLLGIYAIIKCGAAYLPIDDNYPETRKLYMLKDSGAEFLLCEGATGPQPDGGRPVMISLNAWRGMHERYDGGPETGGHSLAYLIYTSGSTGQPKGVMIEQGSLINRLNWMQRRYPIGEGDVILHKTSFSFDVSVWELFWWALTGASVCLMAPQTERFCDSIASYIQRQKITIIHFVPSMLAIFLDYIEEMEAVSSLLSLRQVFASGEALSGTIVEKFHRLLPWSRLTNLYGPTEATIDVTYYDCPRTGPSENIPIGKPIDNMQLYIVDDNMVRLPVGVPGELCIGGVGLARGYMNKDELTRQQFVRPAWFRGVLYRTGDIARWQPDGNIIFLGRRDAQVKVRGYRIEPGEIEYQLQKHPFIRHAIVITRPVTDGEEKELIAYIIADAKVAARELAEFLSRSLPDFMIPVYFVQIDSIPLTSNHKLDKKALPDPH